MEKPYEVKCEAEYLAKPVAKGGLEEGVAGGIGGGLEGKVIMGVICGTAGIAASAGLMGLLYSIMPKIGG
ncbi:hypothetical protein HZC30_05415 [Candidatus Woesearchaeota archaeon]|nr:hypothetical protein [Candidatus Woesearchaeota archaeon]